MVPHRRRPEFTVRRFPFPRPFVPFSIPTPMETDLATTVRQLAEAARAASLKLAVASTEAKNRALTALAETIEASIPALIAANVVSDTASACGANTVAARPSSRSRRARPTEVCSSTITIALPLPT